MFQQFFGNIIINPIIAVIIITVRPYFVISMGLTALVLKFFCQPYIQYAFVADSLSAIVPAPCASHSSVFFRSSTCFSFVDSWGLYFKDSFANWCSGRHDWRHWWNIGGREEDRSTIFLPILCTFGGISDNGYGSPVEAVASAPCRANPPGHAYFPHHPLSSSNTFVNNSFCYIISTELLAEVSVSLAECDWYTTLHFLLIEELWLVYLKTSDSLITEISRPTS